MAEHRSGAEQKIRLEAAEHYSNYAAIVDRAVDVFGDAALASEWLSKPNSDMAGKAPLQVFREHDFAASALAQIIDPALIRIEHGIYL